MELEARMVEYQGELRTIVELGGKAFLVERDSEECYHCGSGDAIHIESIPDDEAHIMCPACGATREP